MKEKKKALIVSIGICMALIFAVMIIVFTRPEHKHNLGQAKVYHVSNSEVYYTRRCKCGDDIRFDTKIPFEDVMLLANAEDKIVLDEDIVLNNEVIISSVITRDGLPIALDLNINFDLNNHTISTNIQQSTKDAVFMLNSTYGTIKFNISNGKIETQDLSTIFRVSTQSQDENAIQLNINNVESKVDGSGVTALYAYNNSGAVTVNANNSKFIASNSQDGEINNGVGVFINCDSRFNFTNCYFEGGDAVYVKEGYVNLIECDLVNSGLEQRTVQSNKESFSAIGSCLATETYTTNEGQTKFTINIDTCSMIANDSSLMIFVAQTGDNGINTSINPDSSINVVSCVFSHNPIAEVDYDIVNYPGGQPPVKQSDNTWVVG